MTEPHLYRRHYQLGMIFWIQWCVAMGLILVLLALLTLNKTGEISQAYRLLMVLTLLVTTPVYSLCRVYAQEQGLINGTARLGFAWLLVLLVLGVIGFITKTSEVYSREVMLQWSVLGGIVQILTFFMLHKLTKIYYQHDRRKTKIIIIGTGQLAKKLATVIATKKEEQLVGFVSLKTTDVIEIDKLSAMLGGIEELRTLIPEYRVNKLYIALPMTDLDNIESLYIDFLDMYVDVIWVPDLASLMLFNHAVVDVAGLSAIHFNQNPLSTYWPAAMMKAVIDKILALLAIIVLSPVYVMTAIAIKLNSPGPILFKQKRHGWNGTVINVWKFRSMYVHNDKQVKQAVENDKRVTKVGRFIRRSSIDEIPQFFNVLMGDMSLVGPRPHALEHNNYYTGKIIAYMARHRIKPGITGLAQISGCRGETSTVDQMKRRVEYDLSYINNWSIGLDLKILIKTPFSLFSTDSY